LVLGLLSALAVVLHGDEEIRLLTQAALDAEGGRSITCSWLAHGSCFRFIPPPRWSIKVSPTNAVLDLTESDLKAGISLRLHREEVPTNAPPDWRVWREGVKTRHPNATWLLDSPCSVAGREGWACDLAIPIRKETEALVRVVFVIYPGGVAEFEMRAPIAHEQLARRALRKVLNSLEILPWPPRA
jgi:hypothetical protein